MKVAKWGNSLAIRIPKDVAEALGLEEGSDIDIVPLPPGMGLSRHLTRAEALMELRRMRGMMPADFTFDREEANER